MALMEMGGGEVVDTANGDAGKRVAFFFVRAPAHRPSSGFQHTHFNVQPCRRRHVDQGIQAEQVDLPAHQV